MRNYIPLDFYENNKKTVYTNKNLCEKMEESAIEFNPNEIDLSESSVVEGIISFDNDKKMAKDAKNIERQGKKDAIDDFKLRDSSSVSLIELIDIVKTLL